MVKMIQKYMKSEDYRHVDRWLIERNIQKQRKVSFCSA